MKPDKWYRSTLGAIVLVAALSLSGCASAGTLAAVGGTSSATSSTVANTQAATGSSTAQTVATTASSAATAVPATVAVPTLTPEEDASEFEATTDFDAQITLADDGITVEGEGATVSGSTVTITSAGAYRISGELSDGQIVVTTQDSKTVRLVLDGVSITNPSGPALYVTDAEKVILELAEGTTNSLADGADYAQAYQDAGEPDAAVYSTADLTITGLGTLQVQGNYRHGILTKDRLRINGGTIVVEAVSDGIRGRDYVAMSDGNVTITAGSDGIQSNNDEDPEKGYVIVEGGTLTIDAQADGIQAETAVSITGGTIQIVTGGGSATVATRGESNGPWGQSAASTADGTSAKGIKAGTVLSITGGTVTVDSADDTLHAGGTIAINAGVLSLSTGDDGIHADGDIAISGGDITISKSYEGVESAQIVISGGTLRVTSSDDGVNVVDTSDTATGGGWPGGQSGSSNRYLEISGGYIAVDAGGDGIDINGSVVMSAGTLLINGPTSDGNGALDYDSGFQMTGGLLVAVGSSGMAMAPDTSSTQYAFIVGVSNGQAGVPINVSAQDGTSIVTYVPTKAYRSLVVSSPDLQQGETYTISTGGSVTGTLTDGLLTDGVYTGGSQVTSVTLTSVITGSGGMGGGMGGGMAPGGRGGRRP